MQAYTSASVLNQRIFRIQFKRQKTKQISQSASIKYQISLPFGYETRQDNPLSGASMNARVRNESHTRSTNEIESRRTRQSQESSNETEPRFIERDETRINERDRLGNNSRHLMSTRAPLKGVSAVNTLIGQPVYLEVKN